MSESQSTPDPQRLADVERYLRRRAAAGNGEFYFKSKFIADELGMTSSEVGALVPFVRDAAEGLTIERWSYTNATTWRVVKRGSQD